MAAAVYHPEFQKALAPLLPMMAGVEKPAAHDIKGRRDRMDVLFGSLINSLPTPPDVEVKTYHAKASDGFSVPIHHYFKKNAAMSGPQPAIVHFHGGGLIALNVSTVSKSIATNAQATGIQIFSVDYRLAPENPFPTPVEDCYTGLLWLYEHADEFQVDRSRIITFGESAGGNLAAAVTLMARDRSLSPPIAKQVLVYPMLDDRNRDPSPNEAMLIWTSDDNITGWTAYLGEQAGKEGVSPHAAPARATNFEGLPPTYIDVGTLDLFRDEDIAYALKLAAANIEVELHVYPGMPHAFEAVARDSDTAMKAFANRLKAFAAV